MTPQEQKIIDEIIASPEFSKVAKTFSGFSRKTIYIIIGVVVLLAVGYIMFSGLTPSYVKNSEKTTKQLEKRVDSASLANKVLDQRLSELEGKATELVDQMTRNIDSINENNKKITQIKKTFDAKIKSINNYSVRDLDSFFTNRYKQQ